LIALAVVHVFAAGICGIHFRIWSRSNTHTSSAFTWAMDAYSNTREAYIACTST